MNVVWLGSYKFLSTTSIVQQLKYLLFASVSQYEMEYKGMQCSLFLIKPITEGSRSKKLTFLAGMSAKECKFL